MAQEPFAGPVVNRGSAALSTVADPDVGIAQDRYRSRHIVDLLGGTTQMRESTYAQEWLPSEEAESATAYRKRLRRSFLVPLFADAIDKLVSKPFSRPVQLRGADQLDRRLWGIEEDADGEGRSLTQALRALMFNGTAFGASFKLVDFPSLPERLSEGDEIRYGIRPTIVQIDKQQILGGRLMHLPRANKMILIQLRYMEDVEVPAGDYGVEKQQRIRVWNAPEFDDFGLPMLTADGTQALGSVKTWVQTKEGWKQQEDRPHTYPGIPLADFYTERTGFLTANPPLEDLGWLNIDHWQMKSDLRHILHHAQVPMLFFAGLSPEDIEKPIELGVTRAFKSESDKATATYIEPEGSSIKLGMEALKELEARAEVLGSAPLFERAATATEVRTNDGRTTTRIQEWIRSVETAALSCYRMAARWLNPDVRRVPDEQLLPEDFAVDVYSDFVVADAATIQGLNAARANGDLDRRTYLTELQRLGVLSPTLDVDLITEAIEKELMGDLARGAFGVDRQTDQNQDDGGTP